MSDEHEDPWAEVDVAAAPGTSPVAFGGNLGTATLISAYRHGLFPWPAPSEEMADAYELLYDPTTSVNPSNRLILPSLGDSPFAIPWWSPDPRPVIPTGKVHLSNNLRRFLMYHCEWTTTANVAFDEVVQNCRNRQPTWITEDLVHSLGTLHDQGWAHSVEVWEGGKLVGGIYGIATGRVFSADSMFHTRSNASKVAMADLAERFRRCGGRFVDQQVMSAHAAALGAVEVSRSAFVRELRRTSNQAKLDEGRKMASRLGDGGPDAVRQTRP